MKSIINTLLSGLHFAHNTNNIGAKQAFLKDLRNLGLTNYEIANMMLSKFHDYI